jgi:hypothetical protein
MGRIYTHSSLEDAVCDGKLLDAMKPRHGKAGPARAGQAFHSLSEQYLEHLHRHQRDSDVEEGRRLWGTIRAQLCAEDEALIAPVARKWLEQKFGWILKATEFAVEVRRYRDLAGHELLGGPLAEAPCFSWQADLTWYGEGPRDDGAGPMWNVLDWKTGFVIEHIKAPGVNRQLLRYASALKVPGPVRVWLAFPRYDYLECEVLDEEETNAAWDELIVEPILFLEKRMLRGDTFDGRTVGMHCAECDLRRGCDAALRYPYTIGPDNVSDRDLLAGKMLAERAASDLAERIKAALAERGRIEVDETEAFLRVDTTLKWTSPETIKPVLADWLPDEVLSKAFVATKTSLERVMVDAGLAPKARRALMERLAPLASEERKTVLRVGKVRHEREHG